jgi:hypothetical protein
MFHLSPSRRLYGGMGILPCPSHHLLLTLPKTVHTEPGLCAVARFRTIPSHPRKDDRYTLEGFVFVNHPRLARQCRQHCQKQICTNRAAQPFGFHGIRNLFAAILVEQNVLWSQYNTCSQEQSLRTVTYPVQVESG